jgi:4-nitrophenyl phosphatase
MPIDFSSVRFVLLDIDGVLYRGSERIPGGREFIAFCNQQAIDYLCITNNGSMTPPQYTEKLAGMGIDVPPERILTSAIATGHYLRARYPHGTTVYAIGMQGVHEALFNDGYFVLRAQHPRLVVLGPDFAVTYEKLMFGCLAIRAGADFILTNPDKTLPVEDGLIPDAGALGAALQAATDVSPIVIGKPQPPMYEIALEKLGATPAVTLMIGDRLETDIDGAASAGLRSALVLSGVSHRDELAASPHQPDGVFEDIAALLATMREARG